VGRTCGTQGGGEMCLQVLVGKPEVKRPFGRPRRKWADNIKMELRQVVIGKRTGFGWLSIGSSDGLL
jgi:hypothetical protein